MDGGTQGAGAAGEFLVSLDAVREAVTKFEAMADKNHPHWSMIALEFRDVLSRAYGASGTSPASPDPGRQPVPAVRASGASQ